jgi:hypothetical protein
MLELTGMQLRCACCMEPINRREEPQLLYQGQSKDGSATVAILLPRKNEPSIILHLVLKVAVSDSAVCASGTRTPIAPDVPSTT